MFEFLLFVIVAQACLENPFSTQLMKFPVNKLAHEIEIVVRLVAEPKHLQNSITVPQSVILVDLYYYTQFHSIYTFIHNRCCLLQSAC